MNCPDCGKPVDQGWWTMSDLRERLIEAACGGTRQTRGSINWTRAQQAIDATLPIIEAELQKRDQEIERLKQDVEQYQGIAEAAERERWVDANDYAILKQRANKLLEQTVEVLEGFEKVATPDLPLPRIVITWWRAKARPHLTKLKER